MATDEHSPGLDGHDYGDTEKTALEVSDPYPNPPQLSAHEEAQNKAVQEVLSSDIGINTLLNRLKQSIASSRDFVAFLKKRSTIEEDHAQGLKKLCKSTAESLRRVDSRGDSFGFQNQEIMRIHERIAENGMQFALSLHQMQQDLNELTNNMEHGRKEWKVTGLTAEKKAADAEMQMDKAKLKYDSLAVDYDRARTGDKGAGKVFGLKGPKSAAQHEEDLLRKLQAADSDYQAKVQAAQAQRQELVNSSRPRAIKALTELITECDAGVAMQQAKFAIFNEKLLLGNGILISPVPGPDGHQNEKSLRELISMIDNDMDFKRHIASFRNKVKIPQDIRYQKHPTQGPTTQPTVTPSQPPPQSSFQPPAQQQQPQPSQQTPSQTQPPAAFPIPAAQQPAMPQSYNSYNQSYDQSPSGYGQQPGYGQQRGYAGNYSGPASQVASPQATGINYSPIDNRGKPVFGVTLEELFDRDQQAVPMVVYICIQAVELYGLDVEGIYRVPGTSAAMQQMRQKFDQEAGALDFRNPESFYHDINSVASLLKQFFRELPEPLFTSANYPEFIDAARIEDDTVRRDSIHAIVNALPDPHYATLRALTFHLHRVQQHANSNRMSSANLAICFAPSLMGPHTGAMQDAGLQAKVIDTILQNTYQIFEED